MDSDNSGDEEHTSSSKRPRKTSRYKNALGSAKFGSSHKIIKDDSKEESKEPINTDADIIAYLNSCNKCCSLAGNLNCCLFNQDDFKRPNNTIKLESIVALIKLCRNCTEAKSKEDLDRFAISLYRESLVSESKNIITQEISHQMSWKIQIRGTDPYGPYVVCRKIFAFVWGITEYKLKAVSKSIKDNHSGYVTNINHSNVPWTDSTRIFDSYSFNDVKDIFEENLVLDEELYGLAPPTQMVRATSTPYAISQQHCVSWMSEYFETFGDHSPNSFEDIKLNAGTMKEQYETVYYPQALVESESLGFKPVSYSLFTKLWSVIYPTVTNRSYCSIMGKPFENCILFINLIYVCAFTYFLANF